MRWRALASTLTLLLWAADVRPLTLSRAVERAIAASPSVAAVGAEVDAARAAIDESGASRLPSLTFGGTATHHSDPMVATPIHGFTPGQLPTFDESLVQSVLTASYAVYDAGARAARVAEARRVAESASASQESARQNAAMRAVTAFAAALGRAAVADAHQARLVALRAERDRVALLEESGRVARVDVLRAEAALAAAEAEQTAAAAALDAAERELARLLDLPLEETRAAKLVPVVDVARSPATRESLEPLVDEAPAVRQARLRAQSLRESIGLARAARWPQLFATANQLSFATPDEILSNEWNAGVQLRFSIFDGGATSARVARATAAARAAEEQARAIRLETAIALDERIVDYERSRAAIPSLEKAVERYAEVARIEKLRLENGVGTQTDYLRAEADLVASRASLANARYGAVIARAAIARSAGILDAKWIADTFEGTP